MKRELKEIMNSIGGNSVLISLGCRIMLDPDQNRVILSDIKNTRKCKYIRITNEHDVIDITYFKTKAYTLIKLSSVTCTIHDLRDELIAFTGVDI